MNPFLRLLLLAAATTTLAHAETRQPNILLILVDDLGYSDLGCFGSEINTPHIDRLAANGLTFTNFTNCAKCETSRTTLMSGRYHTEIARNSRSAITIPEALSLGGYQTFMVGKWHIFDTPTQRGFERYFGFLDGATNFFTGQSTRGNYSYFVDETPFEIPADFYSTDAFTDYALKYIDERQEKKPFFMYLAYNAPHYPLQAPKEEVMKYRGKYKEGWEVIRQRRFERMKALNIIPPDTTLSKPEADLRDWDSLTDAEKDDMDLRMATYAAMVDRVDQQIGRLLSKLKHENILDDTLILFLSDNGACPFDRTRKPTLENNYMPWDPLSYYCYAPEWANVGSAPHRLYKQNQNEGGISTPMIAHWPKGIAAPGTLNRQRGHIIDFHATFLELAGVDYPSEYNGHSIGHSHSLSLLSSFSGQERPDHPYLYHNFNNKFTALVVGDWKLVDQKYLYHLKTDRTEIRDLSQQQPERFQEMLAQWRTLDQSLNPKKKKK